MKIIKVWAPFAKKVVLQIQNSKLAMTKSDNNWWYIETKLAEHGADYGFILDDGQLMPDPRSAWQSNGVFGMSRILDHNKFLWHDINWQAPPLSSAIVYELHVGTFTPEGTFDGVIKHLDFLINLGITHIEIMPVNSFSGSHGWGYDGVDIYAPYEIYGGPEGFKRLVDACHSKGLSVLLDVVYNHMGPEGNYLPYFGPYFSDNYVFLWGKAFNFDQSNSYEVRRFICDNALMWLRDYHVDGLRIDAIQATFDSSAIHILEQLAHEVEELQSSQKKHFNLIIESDLNDPKYLHSWDAGGYNIDAQFNDDFHHALHTVLTGETIGYYSDFGSLDDLKKAYTKVFVYDGCYSAYRKSTHGRAVEGLSGHNFLVHMQTHDQIGNRAKGERISNLVNINRLKIGVALLFTSPFIPMIFQGEEWGASSPFLYFTNLQTAELSKAISEGKVKEFSAFGWKISDISDPQAMETFLQSKLNWQEITQDPHAIILNWYRNLIALRKQFADLNDGRLDKVEIIFDEKEKWFMVKRGKIIVIANFALHSQVISRDKINMNKLQLDILLNANAKNLVGNDNIILQDESVVILNIKD